MADRQLPLQALALRFEIDSGGQAFQLAAAGVGAAQIGDRLGQGCARFELFFFLRRFLGRGERIDRFLDGNRDRGDRHGMLVRAFRDQGFGVGINLGRGDRRSGQGCDHQEGGTKSHNHVSRHLCGEPAGWRAVRRQRSPRVVPRLRGISITAYIADMRMPPALNVKP